MSDKNNLFSDDILKDLESLKSRYSDYEKDDEPIRKPAKSAERPRAVRNTADPSFGIKEKKPAASAPKEKRPDAPVKKAPSAGKAVAAGNAAPAQRPAPAKRPSSRPAPASRPVPAAEPASRPAPAAEPAFTAKLSPANTADDLAVFDGLILTDNGSSMYNDEQPAKAQKPRRRAAEKPYDSANAENYPAAEEIAENTDKKPKKKKSHKLRNILLIVFIAAVLWGALFGIDLVYVSHWHDPIFCKKTAEYENGSKDFVGLFYKVQYHISDNGDISTECMPWFFKGSNEEFKEAEKKGADKADKTEPQNAQVDNTLTDITIPKEYIEEDTTDGIELTAEQKARGYSAVTLNGDGSVTYQLGKTDYEREIQNVKSDVANKLQGLVADNDFPSIKKVDFNDDFSKVSLYVDKAVYQTGLDSFVSQSVSTWVGFYQSFAKQSLACDISVLDYTDGSVIEQSKG